MADETPPLARSLFLGRIEDDLAFPYPRMDDDERKRVDGLITELRSYCDRLAPRGDRGLGPDRHDLTGDGCPR